MADAGVKLTPDGWASRLGLMKRALNNGECEEVRVDGARINLALRY